MDPRLRYLYEDTGEKPIWRRVYAFSENSVRYESSTPPSRICPIADLRLLTHIETKRPITEGNQQFVGAGALEAANWTPRR